MVIRHCHSHLQWSFADITDSRLEPVHGACRLLLSVSNQQIVSVFVSDILRKDIWMWSFRESTCSAPTCRQRTPGIHFLAFPLPNILSREFDFDLPSFHFDPIVIHIPLPFPIQC